MNPNPNLRFPPHRPAMSHRQPMLMPEGDRWSAEPTEDTNRDPVASSTTPPPPCNPTPNTNPTRCFHPRRPATFRGQPMVNSKDHRWSTRAWMASKVPSNGPTLHDYTNGDEKYKFDAACMVHFKSQREVRRRAPQPPPQCEEHVGGTADPTSAQTLKEPVEERLGGTSEPASAHTLHEPVEERLGGTSQPASAHTLQEPVEEHLGVTSEPASAHTLQEPVDSFSDELLDTTEIEESMNCMFGKQANNNKAFSPKQVGVGKSHMGTMTDQEEEDELVLYRRLWESDWGGKFGSFEDDTCMSPTLYTYGAVPAHARIGKCLQIFSIKVKENEKWRINWPLKVYGSVSARDSVDHNRNLLYRRKRGDCQILTEKDPFLQLTGPFRAVMFIDPVDFEIQLKAKGITESEDETLISKRFVYGFGPAGNLAHRCCYGKFCTVEITCAQLAGTLAATVISVEVIQGSWPVDFGGRVVSRTDSIEEDFVLLDSGDGPMHVDSDSHIVLQRSVVCVENNGRLTVSLEAYSKTGPRAAHVEFSPKSSGASIGVCKFDFCTVQFTVGWSLLSEKFHLRYYGA